MHLHLPKAIHGWREFAKEVGIIVLGVLIALGFEQVVQAWRWREDAQTTRQALANEIEYSILWATERLAAQHCLRDRIAHLTAKLDSGGPAWTADPLVLGQPRNPIGRPMETGIPLVYRAPHRPWLSDEWQTAKSDGVIDHMGRNDARDFEFIYRNINQLEALQDEEASLQPQVSFLSVNQTLEPQARVQAFVTLSRLDYLNAMQAQSAQQMLSTIASIHLPLRPMQIGQHLMMFSAARQQIIEALKERYGRCVVDPS
jgi:hypothetical protein